MDLSRASEVDICETGAQHDDLPLIPFSNQWQEDVGHVCDAENVGHD
jgi:hypothetical protein